MRTPEAGTQAVATWAEHEFGEAELGDARLDRRLVEIADAFLAAPQALVPGACGHWAATKAAYRFFDNKKVEPEDMLKAHRQRTVERAREQPVVLALSDTTMLDYTDRTRAIGLGPLADTRHQGMLVQATLAVTPERLPLGVIALHTWVRDWETFAQDEPGKKKRALTDKESGKWLISLAAASRFQRAVGAGTTVVSVFDREGDIYAVLYAALAAERPSPLLVRAKADRRLEGENARLFKHLRRQPVVATLVVRKARQGDREARTATLSVRFAQVTLEAPDDWPAAQRKTLQVWAVYAYEDHPPRPNERISWMLLTTVPVDDADDAVRRVSWYACRWTIEVLFKVLKSGCQIEERQLETYDRLRRCLVVDFVVAWQILYLTTVGRETPNLPCTVLFEEADWKAVWVFLHQGRKPLPKTPPTLRTMTRMIGQLGGHLGRRRDGEPGVVTMWRGLQRLPDLAAMWALLQRDPA